MPVTPPAHQRLLVVGRPFAEITGEIMADVAAFQEAMLTPVKPAQATPTKEGDNSSGQDSTAQWHGEDHPPRTPRRHGKGKAGKGKRKGKGREWKKRQHENDNQSSSGRNRVGLARTGPTGANPATTPGRARSSGPTTSRGKPSARAARDSARPRSPPR